MKNYLKILADKFNQLNSQSPSATPTYLKLVVTFKDDQEETYIINNNEAAFLIRSNLKNIKSIYEEEVNNND